MHPSRVTVVGASLAGLSAIEALRRAGYDGEITAVGAEAHLPYDRPPLSKQVLRGEWAPEEAALRKPEALRALGVDWRLGRRATALSMNGESGGTVILDDGEPLTAGGVVLATGASPRTIGTGPGLNGQFLLRTVGDSVALAEALRAKPRVCVVGAGFIGAEVAASARSLGCEVTVLEGSPAPLSRVLPPALGEACGALHRSHGVEVRTGTGVAAVEGAGRVERVRLTDGTAVAADVVVIGVGVTPAVGWLEGSGLELRDGVVCDATCAAAPGVVAAGDLARWPNPLFGEEMRVEQWSNAVEQGAAAGERLLAGGGRGEPFASVPYFWSDQYDTKIQFVGRARPDDRVEVVDGTIEEGRFVALLGREGRLVGALAFNRPRLLMRYRRLLGARTPFDEAVATPPT